MLPVVEQCLLCHRDTTQCSSRHVRVTPPNGLSKIGYLCAHCAWALGIGWRRRARAVLHIATGIGLGLGIGQMLLLLIQWFDGR